MGANSDHGWTRANTDGKKPRILQEGTEPTEFFALLARSDSCSNMSGGLGDTAPAGGGGGARGLST